MLTERAKVGDELEPESPPPSGPPVQARVALGLAIGAIVGLILMASTVDGTSELALSAVTGDSSAIFGATLGYATGVLLTLGALLLSVQPIAEDHGRRLAITAAALALTSPISASLAASLLRGLT